MESPTQTTLEIATESDLKVNVEQLTVIANEMHALLAVAKMRIAGIAERRQRFYGILARMDEKRPSTHKGKALSNTAIALCLSGIGCDGTLIKSRLWLRFIHHLLSQKLNSGILGIIHLQVAIFQARASLLSGIQESLQPAD